MFPFFKHFVLVFRISKQCIVIKFNELFSALHFILTQKLWFKIGSMKLYFPRHFFPMERNNISDKGNDNGCLRVLELWSSVLILLYKTELYKFSALSFGLYLQEKAPTNWWWLMVNGNFINKNHQMQKLTRIVSSWTNETWSFIAWL